jgi:hypothetical protein
MDKSDETEKQVTQLTKLDLFVKKKVTSLRNVNKITDSINITIS